MPGRWWRPGRRSSWWCGWWSRVSSWTKLGVRSAGARSTRGLVLGGLSAHGEGSRTGAPPLKGSDLVGHPLDHQRVLLVEVSPRLGDLGLQPLDVAGRLVEQRQADHLVVVGVALQVAQSFWHPAHVDLLRWLGDLRSQAGRGLPGLHRLRRHSRRLGSLETADRALCVCPWRLAARWDLCSVSLGPLWSCFPLLHKVCSADATSSMALRPG